MRSTKVIHVVGCHAEGEVGDVIVGGVAPPPGDTVWEQSRWWRRLNLRPDALLSVGCLSCADRDGDVAPCCDSVGAKFTMICGGEIFAMEKKEIGDLAMG